MSSITIDAEVVNQDKCNVVLNSAQTIGVSMEMNTYEKWELKNSR